jgi:PAS domain S-box-containing protein
MAATQNGEPYRMKTQNGSNREREPLASIVTIQRNLAIALTASNTIPGTLGHILNAACKLDGIDCGGIYLVNSETGEYELMCHQNLSEPFVSAAQRVTPRGRQARLLMKGCTICQDRPHFQRSIRAMLVREGLRSTVIVPVKHAGHVVAALNLGSHTLDTTPGESRAAIEAFAAQIGPAIARIRAESALHANERNLQTLFDSLEDFIFIVDMKGRILKVNPLVERRLGYTPAELIGTPVMNLHPRGQRKRAAAIITTMLTGTADACDIPLLAKNGTLIPVETKIVRGEWNGQPTCFGISRDITGRRQAEQELLNHQHELQTLVSQLTLAEENERRRIAHGLHDDINQMLAMAKFKLEHVPHFRERKHVHATVAEVNAYLDHVIRVSRSLTFDLASPVLQRFGLESAVQDLCEKMGDQHGIVFSVHKDKKAKPLSPETEVLIFHAIRELLRNIVSHAKARTARVVLRRTGHRLTITVEDDGVGFGPETITGFTPTGGFGLYAIRERMTHLGGSVMIRSTPPRGSRVTLTVPLAPPPKPPRRHAVRKDFADPVRTG